MNPDRLIAWLRDPQAYLVHSKMPRYQWSDADLYSVTQYITKRLTDPTCSVACHPWACHGR